MNILQAEIIQMMYGFMWPFIRVTAMFMSAPVFGQRAFTVRQSVAIGFVLTWMIFPLIETRPVDPLSFTAIQVAFNEITVGALMGLSLQIVAAAIIIAGHAVSSSMGLGMANMVDPNLGNVPTLSQFLLIISLLVFLALGGHLILISLVVESFGKIPVGAGLANTSAIEGLLAWSSNMFIGGLVLVLPVMLGLLMVNACLGVISRASPSLNVFAVGFPALIPLGFVMLLLTLITMQSKLEGLWFAAFSTLRENLLGG